MFASCYEDGATSSATCARKIEHHVALSTELLVVATLATLLPAWRATRVDPAVVLREE